MDGLAPAPPTHRFRDNLFLAIAFAALFAWHGWLTFTLLSPARTWEALGDSRPVLSGKHPLHQYHGLLGAQMFERYGHLCCYDPAFQAGYPKTPVFDSGSRPAEF